MRRWLALIIAGFALAAAPALPSDVVSFLRDHEACHPKGLPLDELFALLKTEDCAALVQRRNALLERHKSNPDAVCALRNSRLRWQRDVLALSNSNWGHPIDWRTLSRSPNRKGTNSELGVEPDKVPVREKCRRGLCDRLLWIL